MKRQIVIAARKPVMVDLVCPSCGSELTGEEPAPGDIVVCPQCSQEFTVAPASAPVTVSVPVQSNDLHELRNAAAAFLIIPAVLLVLVVIIAFVRLRLAL
jgi:DNA-directed RNA polymerase subunit RPC12/RpoP